MPQEQILRGVRIVDTRLGTIRDPLDILVSETGIAEIGQRVETGRDSVRELDCRDKFVVPGLFECHTHLAALTNQPIEVQQEIHAECALDVPFAKGELSRQALADFLRRGITQVRDLGGPLDILRNLRRSISDDSSAGPEIFYAGPMLEMPPLTGQQMNERWPGWAMAVKSVEDARSVVGTLADGGVSCIKAFGKYEDDVLASLVAAAERHNLPVACDPGPTFFHAVDIEKGIQAGVSCFEHAKSVWYDTLRSDFAEEHDRLRHASLEERSAFSQRLMRLGADSIAPSRLTDVAELMVESGSVLCPTLHISKFFSEKPEVFSEDKPEVFGPVFAVLLEVGRTLVAELARLGVRMLVGQDCYIPRFTHGEMALLSQCGLSNAEILRGATCYPAEWLGVADRYGSIDIGKRANLVILNEDPIEDLVEVRSIFAVLVDGKIVRGPN